jgi:hypothetical protein
VLICAVPDPRAAPLEPIKTAVLAREFGKFEARCVPSCRGSYPLRTHVQQSSKLGSLDKILLLETCCVYYYIKKQKMAA